MAKMIAVKTVYTPRNCLKQLTDTNNSTAKEFALKCNIWHSKSTIIVQLKRYTWTLKKKQGQEKNGHNGYQLKGNQKFSKRWVLKRMLGG